MKIAVHDNTGFKFSQMIIDHWLSKGHDVRKEMGSNPKLAEWADLVYIDFLDNNFFYYFNNKVPKKRMAVRAVDIDVWMGRHRDPAIWSYMDDLIVIFEPHYDRIKNEGHPPEGMMHLIKPGVDLDKYTFKKGFGGYNICMVTGNFWEMKNMIEGFRVFQLVVKEQPDKPWKLHIRGQHSSRELEQVCKDHVLFKTYASDRVIVHGLQKDMNQWYEDMDFIIVPSFKEAFSYAAAEAMCKGIKPVLNNWYGADTIWPKKYRYNELGEAVQMIINGIGDSNEYRQYILERYSLKRMLYEYDELFKT